MSNLAMRNYDPMKLNVLFFTLVILAWIRPGYAEDQNIKQIRDITSGHLGAMVPDQGSIDLLTILPWIRVGIFILWIKLAQKFYAMTALEDLLTKPDSSKGVDPNWS